jgi:transcription elongation factor SPT6
LDDVGASGRQGEATDNVMDEMESDGEANSEDDDFLVDDSEDEMADAETRKQKRKERRNRATLAMNYEQFEDATQIYNDEWLQDLYDPAGDDLFDDSDFMSGGPIRTGEEDKFAALRKQYEPEVLKEMYLTEKDEQIRLTDIPERFQLRYPNRSVPTDEELILESSWIAEKLTSSNSMLDEHTVSEKVKDVLTFLLCSHYEVSFIEHYRKEFWVPILTNVDLWRIYELDHQWYNLQVRKNTFLKALPDDDIIAADVRLADIKRRIEIAGTEDAVQDYTDYYAYHYGGGGGGGGNQLNVEPAPAALEDVVDDEIEVEKTERVTLPKKPVHKRPVRADIRTLAKEHQLDKFWTHFGTKPAELAAAVMNPEVVKVEKSFNFEAPLEVAASLVAPPFFSTAKSVVDGSCVLFATELAAHPQFRARIAEHFEIHGVVSTKATAQGKLYIDLNHQYANVRHLQHKPIASFRGTSLFLQILKAVEEGLLEISISLRKEQVDALTSQLGSSFQLEYLETMAEEDRSSPMFLWAQLRRKILSEAIGLTIPKLVARTKAKLHREATQTVLSEAELKMEKLLRVGPLPIPGPVTMKRVASSKRGRQHNIEDEVEAIPPMVSICVGDPSQSKEVLAMVAILDEHGEIRDTLSILASLRVEDSIALREFFRKHMPFAVAVGIDTPLAKKFFGMVTDLTNAFVAEEGLANAIKCIPMPLDVATIFQATKHAEKEFDASSFVMPSPEAGVLLRRCASAARRLLDPLFELSGLFTQQDHVLGLDLHPLQKHVNQIVLKRRIENAFVRVVSEVGLDVNRILGHTWMQHALQFVPGLGPRKSSSLLEGLIRSDSRLESRNQLKDSAENSQLRPTEYLAPVVWDNAVAFLKVCGNDSLYIRDWNPLDGSRIHPVAYAIAKKIGDDLAASGQIQPTDHYVNAIARDPTLLRHVDLNAMIEKLRSKQVYKELTVRALVEELKAPFADPRVFVETSMSHIFDLVVGKGNMDIGMVVAVRTTFLDRQTQTWEVALPNFVSGSISGVDAPEDLRRGQTVQAQIIGVDKELFKCQLTCNISSSKWEAYSVVGRDAYLVPEEVDLSEAAASISKMSKPSIVNRTFVHRRFANKTVAEAEESLSSKPIGAYIIHPTVRKNLLTITSKFYFNTFAHISVEEKLPEGLKIGNDEYENLDDLVVRFMEPMLMNVKEVEQHSCFKVLNKQEMTPFIQAEKHSNPARSPYHIAPSQEKPGFFVLYYIPGSQSVVKEYIHITPEGFKYRSILHKSVNRLIAYFKQHYNDPTYLAQQQAQRNQTQSVIPTYNPTANASSYGKWPGQEYPPPMPTGMGWDNY